MSRLRLKVDTQDRAHVLAQGSTRRKFKPFAHAFGTKRVAEANAERIVVSVNCHHHMVSAMQRVLHLAQRPNGSTRLALVSRIAAAALKRVNS